MKEHHEDHKALYAFLVASAIFTCVVYALLFQVHSDHIKNCTERNAQIAEVNDRAPVINYLVKLEKLETEEHSKRELAPLQKGNVRAVSVQLTDCQKSFPLPFPFGAWSSIF